MPPAPQLHITVAAITDMQELDLRHETELVKAALLYADRVTLASPKVAFMASIASFTTLDRRQRIEAMAELMGVLDDGRDAARLYADLRRRRRRLAPRERVLLAGLEARLDSGGQDMAAKVEELLDDAGAGELAHALELGVLDLHGLGIDQANESNFTDTIIGGLADVLAESVGAAARTFPLFDNDAGDLMRAMVAEGKVTDVHAARSNEAAAAGRLIAGLDAFPRAAMDDLLDVRRQLEHPLVRFRAALATVTAQVELAAWDEGFDREVEDLYRQQVAPALLEVQQALKELAALPTLLRLASSERVAAVAAGLGLAAAAAVGYGDLPRSSTAPRALHCWRRARPRHCSGKTSNARPHRTASTSCTRPTTGSRRDGYSPVVQNWCTRACASSGLSLAMSSPVMCSVPTSTATTHAGCW